MDKHTRPYKCTILGCKAKDFGNAGDLRRHHREIHTSPAFICPVVTCKRHRKGFGRKDNLTQHIKRTHSDNALAFGSSVLNSENQVVASPNGDSSTGSESGDSVHDELDAMPSKPTDKASLVAKLRELEVLKEEAMAKTAKYDGDIAALRRVLSFM